MQNNRFNLPMLCWCIGSRAIGINKFNNIMNRVPVYGQRNSIVLSNHEREALTAFKHLLAVTCLFGSLPPFHFISRHSISNSLVTVSPLIQVDCFSGSRDKPFTVLKTEIKKY